MSNFRHLLASLFGWKMGFEPTTFGTTIRHSNRLSYIHHLYPLRISGAKVIHFFAMSKFFGLKVRKNHRLPLAAPLRRVKIYEMLAQRAGRS